MLDWRPVLICELQMHLWDLGATCDHTLSAYYVKGLQSGLRSVSAEVLSHFLRQTVEGFRRQLSGLVVYIEHVCGQV